MPRNPLARAGSRGAAVGCVKKTFEVVEDQSEANVTGHDGSQDFRSASISSHFPIFERPGIPRSFATA
jgi:hypothetical protein